MALRPTEDLPALTVVHRASGRLRFGLRATGFPQLAALALCGLRILIGRLLAPGAGAAAREARWLAATLGALKGPFAKVAQFAALRVDLAAPEVREALLSLRDRVPPLPFPWIRATVEEELGSPLERHFAAFEEAPLGAASIAQVHRARLLDGTEVAVKVQYPWLQRALPADLFVLRLSLAVLGLGRRSALFGEFAAGVREELDFRREATHADEIAANLASDSQVVVPRVFPAVSGERVLTMAWHPALALHDRAALAARGVRMPDVLEVIARAWARQVFVDGLFHADPHPGNLFVLDEPAASREPRVLFVDFGLSHRLAPELRRELRAGIYAVLKGDLDAFLAAMQRLQMVAPGAEPAVREAVGGMFARLRGEGGGPLGLGGDRILALKDEAKRLLYETEGLALPTDLLLYAKTVSYLFGLGAELAPETDLMKIVVPYLLRFLAAPEEGPTATTASAAARPGGG